MSGPSGYIVVTNVVELDEETHQFSAFCPELGVATCADDLSGAFAALRDATTLYLNSLEEEGERGRVFAERNIVALS
jgi:predicted RNase H-like HicB family nuclease